MREAQIAAVRSRRRRSPNLGRGLGGSGIELLKQMRAMNSAARLLVSSMHDENTFAERALHAGAMGYVSKEEASDKIVLAIRSLLAGKVFLSPQMTERMMSRLAYGKPEDDRPLMETLSDRELEVIQLIGKGLGTRQVAENLHLSPKTVETHRESIKKKLNLRDGAELMRQAVRRRQNLEAGFLQHAPADGQHARFQKFDRNHGRLGQTFQRLFEPLGHSPIAPFHLLQRRHRAPVEKPALVRANNDDDVSRRHDRGETVNRVLQHGARTHERAILLGEVSRLRRALNSGIRLIFQSSKFHRRTPPSSSATVARQE
ncbi:MAG: response regulator transcription factor [Candidatus Sumerlaeota bacterium]|nr:response regulator transcription factor [Candidatus Sumerlaeota bacterium]